MYTYSELGPQRKKSKVLTGAGEGGGVRKAFGEEIAFEMRLKDRAELAGCAAIETGSQERPF